MPHADKKHPSDSVITIAPWKDDKRFAYSITYDEGLIETAGFAWRIHRRYGIPGHVNALPGMLGKLVGDASAGFLQSLWNLQKYAGPEHLQFLMSEGWSIGCQFSPSDDQAHTVDSLRQIRLSLEQALACPVHALAFTDFASCEANQNLAQKAGFRWLFTRHDDLNAADESTHVIKRSPLYHLGPTPVRLANDPYRLLALARDRGSWVVDVVRLIDRYPSDPTRDCTPAELEARFRALCKIGGDGVWTASPETVASYRALRLATQIRDYVATPQQVRYTLAVTDADDLPAQDTLTFVARPNAERILIRDWQSPRAIVGQDVVHLQPGPESGTWLFTHPVVDGLEVEIADQNPFADQNPVADESGRSG